MQNFCIAYRGILSRHNLFATGTTGRLIEEVTNLNIHKYLAGCVRNQTCSNTDINKTLDSNEPSDPAADNPPCEVLRSQSD